MRRTNLFLNSGRFRAGRVPEIYGQLEGPEGCQDGSKQSQPTGKRSIMSLRVTFLYPLFIG